MPAEAALAAAGWHSSFYGAGWLMTSPVLFIPIASTLIAVPFAVVVLQRWRSRRTPYLLWWGIGFVTYGIGTALEAATSLWGWHLIIFKAWYIAGALLGGAPLAQGTVYLLMTRRVADRLAALLVGVVVLASACVVLSPVNLALVEQHRLTGAVLSWQWVRAFSPFINTYAFVCLVGGAVLSAVRYSGKQELRHRFTGNVAIAIGALLPGIGGSATRFGHTEVLYVTEFLGLILMWIGYSIITKGNERPRPA
jgi:hypothetical protein